MAVAEMYEMKIVWPSTQPKSVVVSGTFNQWGRNLQLTKTPTGFETTVKVPWNEKVKYKFLVDGFWSLLEGHPTEMDPGGFVNNVYNAPPKPAADAAAADLPPPSTSTTTTIGNGFHAAAANGKAVVDSAPGFLSNLANTIAARDGTSSALEYVASGIGAAVHSVVGVDPINYQKIAIPTPKADAQFMLPDVPSTPDAAPAPAPEAEAPPAPPAAAAAVPESPASPIAPGVPIMVVPVLAAENNTVGTSPTTEPHDILTTPLPLPDAAAPAPAPTPAADEAATEPVPEKLEEPSTHAAVVPAAGETSAPVVAELVAVENTATVEPTPAAPAEEKAEETPTAEAAPALAVEAPAEAEKTPEPVKEETTVPTPVVEAVKAEEPTAVPAIEEVVPEAKKEETPAEAKTPEPAGPAPAPAAAEPTPIPSVAVSPAKETPPALNGTMKGEEVTPAAAEPTTNGKSASPPVTPKKHRFPSFSSDSPSTSTTGSPASSKFGSTRKKRGSIFGKIKKIFHHEHSDKEEGEKEKAKK